MIDAIKKKRLTLTVRVLSVVILTYILAFPYLQSRHSNLILKDLRLVNEEFLKRSVKLSSLSRFISVNLTKKYRNNEIIKLDPSTVTHEINKIILTYIQRYPNEFKNSPPKYQPLPTPLVYNFEEPHSGVEKLQGNFNKRSFLTSYEFVLIVSGSKIFNIGSLKVNTNLSNHSILKNVIIVTPPSSKKQSLYDKGVFKNIIVETFKLPIGHNRHVYYYMSLGEALKRDTLIIALILLLTLKFFIIKIGQHVNEEKDKILNIATKELNRDTLTGLLNRRHLHDLLQNKKLDKYTITIIDGDKFKEINDTYGHNVGDLVIKHIAKKLYIHSRKSDFVYRLGGDEFLVLFFDMPEKAIETLMNEINSRLNQSTIGEHTIPISISYGYAHIRNHKSFEEAFKTADKLLYNSKRSQR